VWLVRLAGVAEPEHVAAAVADALGCTEEGTAGDVLARFHGSLPVRCPGTGSKRAGDGQRRGARFGLVPCRIRARRRFGRHPCGAPKSLDPRQAIGRSVVGCEERGGLMMSVVTTPQEFNVEQLFVDLEPIFDRRLFLKCEGFNFTGSIKLKAANEMVEAAERDGLLGPGSVLVESSSGNLGVALSMIAASKGYRFVCITDSRCNLAATRLMEALGARVHTIFEPDPQGGFLGARINYVHALCAADKRYVWLNQYANPNNWKAHFLTTAPAIADWFPRLDVLFVGAGTTGTLMGCARFFRQCTGGCGSSPSMLSARSPSAGRRRRG
jgi:Pyridoxal-phosphate dependent enzyme